MHISKLLFIRLENNLNFLELDVDDNAVWVSVADYFVPLKNRFFFNISKLMSPLGVSCTVFHVFCSFIEL
jgi:hypothetical protein